MLSRIVYEMSSVLKRSQSPVIRTSSKLIRFTNCRLVRDHKLVWDQLWIKDGIIVDPEPVFFDGQTLPQVSIDCRGNIISPGFIDLQINGGYGLDFSNPSQTREALDKVANGIVAHGVTAFCPTIVTSPPETYRSVLPAVRHVIQEAKTKPGHGAQILGCHLEGPFISHEKKGAHPEQLIRSLNSFSSLEEVYGPGNVSKDIVSIITLAPELDPDSQVIKALVEKGIVVSIGHSKGTLNDGERAVSSGSRFITHLFNAMLPFHHRDPGLVGLLTSDVKVNGKNIFYGIIADGIHTHYTALKIAYRSHPEGCVLVTDALSAFGLPSGHRLKIGEAEVEVRDNKAYVTGTNTLAGSTASLDECVKNLYDFADCSLVEAVECATLHAAKVLGIQEKKGTLNFGSDADFVIMTDDMTILQTYIAGKRVWCRPDNCI